MKRDTVNAYDVTDDHNQEEHLLLNLHGRMLQGKLTANPLCNVFVIVNFSIKSKPESLVPQMKCQIQIEYQEFGLKL